VPSILAAVRTQFLPLSLPTFAVMARAAPIILLGLTRQCQAISLRAEPADACLDAVPGDSCHNFVAWALDKGVEQHPEWFPSFKRSDSDVRNFMQVQDILHSRNKAGCGKPCDMEYLDVIGKLEKELSAMDTNSPAFETRLAEKREKINKLKAALELKAKGKAQQLQDQQKRQKLEAELKALESMEDSPASQTLIAEKRAQIQNLQTADKSESELKALEIQRLQDPAAAAMDAKDAAAGRKSWWQRWREAKGTAPTAAAPEAKPAPAAAVEEAKPEAAAPSPPAAEEEAKPEAATPSPAAEEAELEAELMAAAAGEAQPSHNAPLAEAPPAAGAPPAAEEEPAEEMPSADAEPQKEARAAREPESAVMEVPAQAPATEPECRDAAPGDRCHEVVAWSLSQGLEAHPDYFPSFYRSISEEYNFKQIQEILHSRGTGGCSKPCHMDVVPPPAAEAQAPTDAAVAQDAAVAEDQTPPDAGAQDVAVAEDQGQEEEVSGTETTLEPMSSKSLSEMSPEELQTYMNNPDELDKYAYYVKHTSRRKRWEDALKREQKLNDASQ